MVIAGIAAIAGSGAVATGLLCWRSLAPPRIESIAVLPLDNLSGDAAQEFFADGMTDELTSELARIQSLRVISRTSAMRYKGHPRKPLQEIARELRVEAIVEGSVVRIGGRVRITARLILAADDRPVWTERYERDAPDVLALQSEVARAIGIQVKRQVVPDARRPRQISPEAHEAYLRAYAAIYQGPLGITRSVELFRRAVELDPNNANANAGLAEALCYAGIFSFRPSEETYPEARGLAMKALELDDSNASAHNVLAEVKKGYDWDLPAAEAEYRRALQLNPSHHLTRLWFAEMWSRLGRFDEAVAESHRAGTLDPMSPTGPINLALILWRARRFDEAIVSSRRALEIAPVVVNAWWWQGLAYAGKSDFEKAVECLRKAEEMNPGPMTLGYLGHVLALSGRRAQAVEILAKLKSISAKLYVAPFNYAAIHAGLGDREAAFEWMEVAFRCRNGGAHVLRTPLFDSFRDDRRYSDFLRRTGVA